MSEPSQGTNGRKVLFLLGSGVSSGICPDVGSLIQSTLNPDPKWFGYDQDEEFEAIVGFLKVLNAHAMPMIGKCTYEDLFSMCDQLAKWDLKLVPDPALRLFREEISEKSKKHWTFYAQEEKCYLQDHPLAAIALKAQHAIHVVIRKALIGKIDPRKQLDFISEAISKLGTENVDVLTLNHDCLVEALLDREGIKWTDGFDPEISQDGDVINFDARAFNDRKRIRIVKLHGGCDWYYAGTSIENFRWIKSPTDTEIEMCRDASREDFYADDETAPTLTGTTTKTSAYTEGIHAALYLASRKLLNQHEHIICSGYGWNDYGFNKMLLEWAKHQLWHEDKRRLPQLLLLHKDDNLGEFAHPKNSQHARRNLWFWPQQWKENLSQPWRGIPLDWMRCHKKWLACTHFSEIEEPFFRV